MVIWSWNGLELELRDDKGLSFDEQRDRSYPSFIYIFTCFPSIKIIYICAPAPPYSNIIDE